MLVLWGDCRVLNARVGYKRFLKPYFTSYVVNDMRKEYLGFLYHYFLKMFLL